MMNRLDGFVANDPSRVPNAVAAQIRSQSMAKSPSAVDRAAKPGNLRSKRLNGQITGRPDRRAFFFST
jgi:hypothetical protein